MLMSKYLFSIVIFLSIASGLLFPSVTVLWKDYQNFLLALLMFFSALRLEKKDLEKANPRQLLVLLLFVFVLMPLLSLPFMLTDSMTFIGVLFALASPSAAATAFFISFLGGDIALGVAISFIASLLSIVTLPTTVYLLGGVAGSIDNNKIFTILIEVIIIPILTALISRKLFKKLVESINKHKDYQLVVMFLLASSIIGVSYGNIVGNEYLFLQETVMIFFILLLGGVLAYLFGMRYGKKSAITFFVATSVKNAMLSFAIVLKLFGTTAVLPMVANLIAQFILMALFEIVGCRIL